MYKRQVIFIRRKNTAHFRVCTVTYDRQKAIFHQFRDVAAIADCYLLPSIVDGRVFFDSGFELKNCHRNAVYKQQQIRATQAVTLHRKLVDHLSLIHIWYAPLAIRNSLAPIAGFGSQAAWFLFLMGLLFDITNLMTIGIWFFVSVVLFQVITLPVEFNASSRAINLLVSQGLSLIHI